MHTHSWLLLDDEENHGNFPSTVNSSDIGANSNWKVTVKTLSGGVSAGVQIVDIYNGQTTLSVIPTRGMGIWHVTKGESILGWRSPIRRPVHPNFVPLEEPSGLGFLSGVNELMFRCGLESNGVPQFDERGRLIYGLHGKIANTPAHRLKLSFDAIEQVISLEAEVDESRFLFQKLRLVTRLSTRVNSQTYTWHDRVENIGGKQASLQMIYHVNIGQPLLDPGSHLVAPVRRLAPRDAVGVKAGVERWHTYPGPDAQSVEQVYFMQLNGDENGETQVVLRNSQRTAGVSLQYNLNSLPYFTQWRNTQDPTDGYVTGIEPGTNFPNPKAFEESNERVIKLAPQEAWEARVSLEWLTTPASVEKASQQIAQIQGAWMPEICSEALPEWSGTMANAVDSESSIPW